MKPQWEPPSGLRDPFLNVVLVKRAVWTEMIRGRIPSPYPGPSAGFVAHTLANHGNPDGTSCWPGVARLAAETCLSPSTVKRALAWATEAGWLTIANRGRSRKLGHADNYSLSVPAPVVIEVQQSGAWKKHLPEWDPKDPQWGERPPGEAKRAVVEVTRDPKNPRLYGSPVTSRKKVLGVTNEFVGVTSDVVGVTGDPPPGSLHPVPLHPSDARTHRPHAAARGSDDPERGDPFYEQDQKRWEQKITVGMILDGIDLEDDLNLFDDIETSMQHYGLEITDPQRFDAMAADGRIKQAVAVELAEQQRI